MTPAVQVDRENIGGNESGQQASFVALGGDGDNDTWTMDGVNITDPAASGASPTYYDYDVFEELNITIGGADVEQHTGGVSINFVSRRGGNRVSLGGRFYYTEERFQTTPPSNWDTEGGAAFPSDPTQWDELQQIFGIGKGFNNIRDIKDFGFNVGGPILADKLWWWGSYGVQEIKTTVMNGSNDDTFLNNYAFKINLQLVPENRLELFIHAGDKVKLGRSSSSSYPSGYNQGGKYHFGSPILKIQNEHMFGDNLFVSAKFGYTNAGFGMWPRDDPDLTDWRYYDVENDLLTRSWWFMTDRPNTQITLHGTYFNDNLFGASHEIKAGFEYRNTQNQSVSGSGAGNMRYNFNYNTATINWSGIDPILDTDATQDVMRDELGIDIRYLYFYRGEWQIGPGGAFHVSGFLQDVIAMGRFTLKLGLRYDQQTPYYKGQERRTIFSEDTDATYFENYYEIQQNRLDAGVPAAINAIFPGVTIPPVLAKDTLAWKDFSPRIGLTWDATGDGRTIAKLSGAIYRGRMSSTQSYRWQQGGAGGWMRFWWNDADSSESVALSELYWADYSDPERTAYPAFSGGAFVGDYAREENLMWGGYDFNNPGATTAPWYTVDPNWHSERTYEMIATVEREVMTDFAVAVDFTWRKYNGWGWNRRYYDTAGGRFLEKSDFVATPNAVPTSINDPATGDPIPLYDAAGRNIYGWDAGVVNLTNRYSTNTGDDYHDIYIGFNIRANKRLSNKWMAMGSFTWQDQKNYWGADYPQNPTNQWASDGELYAYSLGGGSGKVSMMTFSSWMVKMQGLYQLPYDFNVSFTFNARQGHIIEEYVNIQDNMSPNSADRSNSLSLRPAGSNRLPTFWNLNLRLEKILRIGDVGKVYLMVDAFNVFNSSILNRMRDVNTGTIYVHNTPPTISTSSRSGEPNEVLNPRVFRFGLRFQF
jgi:hypothetical protein